MVGRAWLPPLSLALCVSTGCRESSAPAPRSESTSRVPAEEAKAELSVEFLKRGQSALLERIGSQARLLEIRARGRHLSYSVLMGKELKQLDYVEDVLLQPLSKGSTEHDSRSIPVGKIFGPDTMQVVGAGPLDDNLFDLKDVQLVGIAQSFPIALQAVDPIHGRVTSLVVRRFLPFSTGIRARIYVDSPTMSGSIDTNERGIPLKKR